MEWFKEEFAKSTIISGFLAITVWLAVIYLAVMQLPIPDILYAGGISVIGFFFGSRQGQAEGRNAAVREFVAMRKEE